MTIETIVEHIKTGYYEKHTEGHRLLELDLNEVFGDFSLEILKLKNELEVLHNEEIEREEKRLEYEG